MNDTLSLNIPLAPLSQSEDGNKITCRNCNETFIRAKRCTYCGQLIDYSEDFGNTNTIDYSSMVEDINKCETKKDLMEAFRKYGFRSLTTPTETQNSGDLYYQFCDGSRLHCQKTQFTLYTCPSWTNLYFPKYSFKECNDGSYRTRKATKIPKNAEELSYILSVFSRFPDNLV